MVKKITKKELSFSEEKNNEEPLEIEGAEVTPPPQIAERKERTEDLPETKAISKVSEFSKPLITATEATQSFQQYQELIGALMKESDIVEIQGKKKVKKTGINKIARFFGVSSEIIRSKREDWIGPQGGKNFTWYVWAKAWLPNGQSRVDGAACASNERRFAHIENDVLTTAITRATKRAIENLVGMGELELIETEDLDESPVLSKLIVFIKTALDKLDLDDSQTFVINGVEKNLNELSEGEATAIVADIKKGKEAFLNNLKKGEHE